MNGDIKICSCFCLFDTACLSKVKKESFQEIGLRISAFMTQSFNKLLERDYCKCSLCKPVRFRTGGVWVLQ